MRRDRIKTPDFDILARAYLGRGLRKHPDAAKHVANVLEIEDMPIWRLMTLAKKMNGDANATIQDTEEHEHRLRRYSDDFPAFTGVIEFDLAAEVFGQRVTRKAKAEYTFTPEWPYFDLHKQAPFQGWSGSSIARGGWQSGRARIGRGRHPGDRRGLECHRGCDRRAVQGRGRRTSASSRSPKVCAETVESAPLDSRKAADLLGPFGTPVRANL
jgi:hypothetical protein